MGRESVKRKKVFFSVWQSLVFTNNFTHLMKNKRRSGRISSDLLFIEKAVGGKALYPLTAFVRIVLTDWAFFYFMESKMRFA